MSSLRRILVETVKTKRPDGEGAEPPQGQRGNPREDRRGPTWGTVAAAHSGPRCTEKAAIEDCTYRQGGLREREGELRDPSSELPSAASWRLLQAVFAKTSFKQFWMLEFLEKAYEIRGASLEIPVS